MEEIAFMLNDVSGPERDIKACCCKSARHYSTCIKNDAMERTPSDFIDTTTGHPVTKNSCQSDLSSARLAGTVQ